MASVTAALCVRNQPEHLPRALAALQAQTLSPAEIIVVDDGSVPPLTVPDGVRLLRHETNRGLAAARNTALSAATGDLLFFIDADVVPAPDCLAQLGATLPADAAGCGATISEAVACTVYDRFRARFLAQQPPEPLAFLPGLCVLYRTEALRAAGGFDERYRSNGEDYDLGRRLRARGLTLQRSAAARAEHHRADTIVSFCRLLYRYHYFEHLVRRRHGLPWFMRCWLLPLLNLPAVARRCLDAPALLWPLLLTLPCRWLAALRLLVSR